MLLMLSVCPIRTITRSCGRHWSRAVRGVANFCLDCAEVSGATAAIASSYHITSVVGDSWSTVCIYVLVGQDGATSDECAAQFSLQCLDIRVDGVPSLEPLQSFAEGVDYEDLPAAPASQNEVHHVDGYNRHESFYAAHQVCALDCDCIGIVLATDRGPIVTAVLFAIIVGVPALLVLITVLRIWYGRNAHEFPTNTDLPAVSLVADGGVAHVYVCRPVPFVYQLIAGLQQKIHIAYQIGGIDRALKEQQWLKGYTTDNVAEASLKRWVGVDVNSTSFSVSVLNHALMVWSTPVPAPLTLYVSIAL